MLRVQGPPLPNPQHAPAPTAPCSPTAACPAHLLLLPLPALPSADMKGASSALWADIKPSKSEEEKHNIRWTNKVGGRAGGLAGGWTSRSLVSLTGAAVCVPGCACIAMCVGGLMGLACRMPPPGALPLMPACARRCLCPAGDLLRPPQEGINAVLAHQPRPLWQEAWLSLPSIPAAAIQQQMGPSPLFSATPAARPQHCTALGNIAPPVVLPRFRRPLFGRVHRPSAARGGES